MKDCIFCKIIDREIPNYTVYEDNHCLAFLDINPIAKGHTVVIPKVHTETILDLNDELQKDFWVGVKQTLKRVEERLQPEGFNIGINHGEVGGQVVPHLHVHIIPRWRGDGGGHIHSIVRNPGIMKVEEVAKLF